MPCARSRPPTRRGTRGHRRAWRISRAAWIEASKGSVQHRKEASRPSVRHRKISSADCEGWPTRSTTSGGGRAASRTRSTMSGYGRATSRVGGRRRTRSLLPRPRSAGPLPRRWPVWRPRAPRSRRCMAAETPGRGEGRKARQTRAATPSTRTGMRGRGLPRMTLGTPPWPRSCTPRWSGTGGTRPSGCPRRAPSSRRISTTCARSSSSSAASCALARSASGPRAPPRSASRSSGAFGSRARSPTSPPPWRRSWSDACGRRSRACATPSAQRPAPGPRTRPRSATNSRVSARASPPSSPSAASRALLPTRRCGHGRGIAPRRAATALR
mmetsp:Transcript_51746/g.143310  ORF Transcript_51746/g.143310 Transcript_51746/m.143310 type:complete len:328 (+) Transcript_51746:122-1105(+)